ncbi:diaminopimelate epimerase [candidate division WOR-3 bacterium]|nr:diaminopimelate epimerase [candidate division WOR-3 bacterium]
MFFSKYQANGNDYIILNLIDRESPVVSPEFLAKNLCDRKRRIGGDGLLILSNQNRADMRLKIYNRDGSSAQMCGNGLRSAALYYYINIKSKVDISVGTDSGIKRCEILNFSSKNKASVKTEIGRPLFDISEEKETFPLKTEKNSISDYYCVSLGNPHAVVLVEDVEKTDLKAIFYENILSKIFPEGVNISAVECVDSGLFSQRVYERGAGETLSCGTGAAAAYSVLRKLKMIEKDATASQRGGTIKITESSDGQICLIGEAEEVFKGEINELF